MIIIIIIGKMALYSLFQWVDHSLLNLIDLFGNKNKIRIKIRKKGIANIIMTIIKTSYMHH